jgi:ATP phosphoribosyltransferase
MNASAFFARAGLAIERKRGDRDYRGSLADIPEAEVHLLSASEIAAELQRGGLHLGVTGADLLHETIPDLAARIEIVAPLGFGQADVVVAVPEAWIDVSTMDDLEDVAGALHASSGERLRVATKYVALTRRFFAEKGLADYRIVESLGATEGAPLAGAAEAIVDITTSGATLAANGLKALDDGVILKSQASLAASLRAEWSAGPLDAARRVLGRIVAEERARLSRELRVLGNPDGERASLAAAEFGATMLHHGQGPMTMIVPVQRAAALADRLIAEGAAHVSVHTLDYVFGSDNPLFDRLAERIDARPE